MIMGSPGKKAGSKRPCPNQKKSVKERSNRLRRCRNEMDY
jgi:hypothetical protein